MIPLVIILSCLSGLALGLSGFSLWKSGLAQEGDRFFVGKLQELEGRIEGLELRWIRALDELTERMTKGNDAWRKVRQAQSYAEREEELEEESEGQPVNPAQEVLPLDVEGSDPRGLSYMPTDVGGSAETSWRATARALGASIAAGSH